MKTVELISVSTVPPKCTSAETPKSKKRQVFFDEFLDGLFKDY